MAKPKAKSVGILLNRKEDSDSTFLLRVPKVHNITDGAEIEIRGSTANSPDGYMWRGTVENVVTQIRDPHKKASKVFEDKVAVLQVKCIIGDEDDQTAKAKKKGKAVRPKRVLGDPGDIIVIDVTITNPGGDELEFPDIAGLIP